MPALVIVAKSIEFVPLLVGLALGAVGGNLYSRRQRSLAEAETDRKLAEIERKRQFGITVDWDKEFKRLMAKGT